MKTEQFLNLRTLEISHLGAFCMFTRMLVYVNLYTLMLVNGLACLMLLHCVSLCTLMPVHVLAWFMLGHVLIC